MENEVIEKAILRIKRKFQEGISNEKKLKYLRQLEQLPVTLKILKSTAIGKTVNKLRQDDEQISNKANNLVTKWKGIATTEKTSIKTPEKSVVANGLSESSLRRKYSSLNSPLNTASPAMEEKKKNTASFEDMLLMPLYDMDKKKKKKKNTSPIKLQISKTAMPSLPEISLPNFTPEPVYKPRRPIPEPPKSERKKDSKPQLSVITSKKTRSQMYTGKRASNGIVTSLYQHCMKVLLENIDCLYETGGVPYVLLEPLLSKCTPSQLERLEYYNDYLVDDSSVLWKSHCQHEFKSSSINKGEDETWKETFKRLSVEREERLRRLSSKINASQASKVPERSVKMAYVAGAPKSSSQMLRKQKRYGTGGYGGEETQAEIRERMEKDQRKSDAVAIPFGNMPRRERCSVRPPSSLSTTTRNSVPPPPKRRKDEFGTQGPSRLMPTAVRKPAKKPMMAAALKLLKKQKGRVNSQIIRR